MVFVFDMAKDANTFTELESDCSGTGTERHQGRFCFYFLVTLNKEVLPYLSGFPRQIAPFLLLLWMSVISARNFQDKLGRWWFRAWYSSQRNDFIIWCS